MEYHNIALNNTCRICTARAQIAVHIHNRRAPCYVTNYIDDIYVLFGLDISTDDPNIHSRKMCSSCSGRLHSSRQTGTQGSNCFELNLWGIFGEQKDRVSKVPNIWKPHTDSNCSLCDNYRKQAIGGGSRKSTRRGSIKLKYNGNLQNIFYPYSDSNMIASATSTVSNCRIVYFPEVSREYLTCNICKDVLSLESVSTDCHNFCATCLSGVFKANRKNSIKCPTCYLVVEFDAVKPIDSFTQNLLLNLTLECCECFSRKMYKDMTDHECAVNQLKISIMENTLYKVEDINTMDGTLYNVEDTRCKMEEIHCNKEATQWKVEEKQHQSEERQWKMEETRCKPEEILCKMEDRQCVKEETQYMNMNSTSIK